MVHRVEPSALIPTRGCGLLESRTIERIASRSPLALPAWLVVSIAVCPASILTAAETHRGTFDELVQARRWAQLHQYAGELSRGRPNDPIPRYYVGIAAFQLGEKVHALQSFRAAEKLGLDTPWLHEALGLAYYDANQFELFRQQMENVLQLDPKHFPARFHLGRYYESVRNDFDAAIREFDQALAIRPQHAKALYFKGYCLQMLGKLTEARRCFEAAAKAAASVDAFSLPFQAIARLLTDDEPDDAVKWALKAVELEPAEAENHVVLAQVYRRLARPQSAAKALQESTRLAPDNDSARFMLYQVYRELGNDAAAQAELAVFKELRNAYGDH
jgi:tetratricopeptide (TPR) repeat protein